MSLRVQQLAFAYRGDTPVLRDISLEFHPGQATGLFGPNGSGKSTLLRCLNGALRPQSGRVWLGDNPVDRLRPREIARQVAVVSQDTPVLLPFTALEMVLLGRHPHGEGWQPDSPADIRLARDCLARLDAAPLADRPFDQLSGGERQRVIVARALAQQTPILLWDEPASHLDVKHQLELYRLARSLATEGCTLVMACHDLFLAPLFLDTAVLLSGGTIAATGLPAETLCPQNLAAAFGANISLVWPASNAVSARLDPPH
jgi:iron complex transport system ATP-binding protein